MSINLASSTSTSSSLTSSFALPTTLTSKRAHKKAGLAATSTHVSQGTRARPAMNTRDSSLDAELIGRLSQRFSARLKVSEHASTRIYKSIQDKNSSEAAPQPADAQAQPAGCKTKRLLEKVRAKEQEKMSKIQRLWQQDRANAVKAKVNQKGSMSWIPSTQQVYLSQLEQECLRKQQQETAQYQAQQYALRKQRQQELEEQRKREELAARQAAELKAKMEREEKERREAEERARAAAKAKAEAEAAAKAKAQAEAEAARKRAQEEAEKKRVEEEAKRKAEAEEQKRPPEPQEEEKQAVAAAGSDAADVPVVDISSSLLPAAVLQRRAKPYLQPSAELTAQMQKQAQAWVKYEADMAKYKDMPLDKDFFDEERGGKTEKANTVGVAVTQVTSRLFNPDSNIYGMVYNPDKREQEEKVVGKKTPDQLQQELNDQVKSLIRRILRLNQEFAHNSDVLRFAIFKIVYSFRVRFSSGSKQKDPKVRTKALDYIVFIFDRVHLALPQLHFKEIMLGCIASRNQLFYPRNAQLQDVGNDEKKLIQQRGFNLRGGKRENIEVTIQTLTFQSVVFFSMLLSDAYVGQLFMCLSTLMSLKHTQNQAQVILHLLEVGDQRLLQVYGRAYIEQLKVLKTEFCPSFKAHIQSGEIAKEPQNKAEYLVDKDEMGIRETTLQFDKLTRLIDQLLEQASQAGGPRGF